MLVKYVSQSYVIYYFEKCVTILWNCDTLFEVQILEKMFRKCSIPLHCNEHHM